MYCSKCLYKKTHPFGFTLNNNICSGCITHEEKNTIKWDNREQLLKQILKQHGNKKRTYDCVVPVVGDAEDYYTLSKVLHLGLSPLVVCVNDYFKNDIGWHNLHQLITHFDVDSIVYNPDIRVYKELVRTSLRKFDHIMLPFLMLHTSFPVHIANQRNIPLIIWGQNQSIEQVGKFSHCDAVEMSKWSRKQHDLFNVDIEKLIGNGAQVNIRDLNYYYYPDINKLTSSKKGVTGIYLSNYYRWDPLKQNSEMVNFGFIPENNNYSFDIYERSGSSVYYHLHDLLKFKRCGYKKITDHLTREIRHQRITREQAVSLEKQYSTTPIYIKGFFDWLETTKSGYEWFKLHRLEDVTHLITEEKNLDSKIILPDSLNQLLSPTKKSIEDFLLFKKGI